MVSTIYFPTDSGLMGQKSVIHGPKVNGSALGSLAGDHNVECSCLSKNFHGE
jgi:hypothetical protein